MSPTEFTKQFEPLRFENLGVRVPEFKISPEVKIRYNLTADYSNFDFLKMLTEQGMEKLGLKTEKYKKRIKYELETIEELGFTDYILLVWDIIDFCKINSITVGPGRGSVAGSCVCYFIGITNIDPIKHDLYFERFISKIRAKKKVVDGITYLDGSLMCDIDNDIDYYRRDDVIKYVEEKYKGKTSKILTLNSLSGRLLIKECGKTVADKYDSEMTEVSEMIPKISGFVTDIEEAYGESDQFKDWCDNNKRVYNIALKLRDLIKNKSVHPSALMISYDTIADSCPLELSSNKELISGFDMYQASSFCLKLDLLGLRALSVIKDVCDGLKIDFNKINVDDPKIYQKLYDLKTPHGLFQIEADTNFRVIKHVKPKNLKELSACLALARPGALQFLDRYANFTNNGVSETIHPFFDNILGEYGGLCLFQEQLMKMLNKIGFSLDESELARKIVGKKEITKVKEWKQKIEDKVRENKLDPKISEIVWEILESSAKYSFNASHALAYATVSAITIYLKFFHPKEFFLSLLKMTKFEPDPINEISTIHNELRTFGIKLLPPHLIKSDIDFTVDGENIRFGLGSIKGIAEKTISKINNFRHQYSNKFEIFTAAEEAGLSIGHLSSLLQAGALEGFSQKRSKLCLEAQTYNLLTEKEKKYVINLGKEHDYDLLKLIVELKDNIKDEKSKPIISAKRFETIKKKYEPYKAIYLQNSKCEDLANYFYERRLLGYSYSTTLKDLYKEKSPNLINISELSVLPVDSMISTIGIINSAQDKKSKAGKRYYQFELIDESNKFRILLFQNNISDIESLNNGKLPAEEDIVIIKGKKKEDAIFANMISIQTQKIYTKLSEIKKLENIEK